jgi:uncharacterized circularly permuted ATP-grasp superfamily protein
MLSGLNPDRHWLCPYDAVGRVVREPSAEWSSLTAGVKKRVRALF